MKDSPKRACPRVPVAGVPAPSAAPWASGTADERIDVMSAKLRKALAKLAAFRGISGDELAELSGLATGTIEGSMHRALAVVGGSMVEDALRHAISRHLMSSKCQPARARYSRMNMLRLPRWQPEHAWHLRLG